MCVPIHRPTHAKSARHVEACCWRTANGGVPFYPFNNTYTPTRLNAGHTQSCRRLERHMSTKQSYTLTCIQICICAQRNGLLNDSSVNVECDGKKSTCSPVSICILAMLCESQNFKWLANTFFFSLELYLSHIVFLSVKSWVWHFWFLFFCTGMNNLKEALSSLSISSGCCVCFCLN